MTHILPLCLQYLSQILSLLPHSAPLASSNFQDGATKRHYHLNSYPPLGCPYLQKSFQKHLSQRYAIPIYKKNAFPKVLEFSFFIFLWKVQIQKYKGNFQKYKGNFQKYKGKMLILEFLQISI